MVLTARVSAPSAGDSARSSVIDPARQFADDDHVGAFHQVVLQRRRIQLRRVRAYRAQICIYAQSLANPEEALFRPLLGRCVIEFREADRAHQGRVGGGGEPRRFLRERGAGLVNGDAAEQPLRKIQSVIPFGRDVAQYAHCLAGYFGADAVTGKNQNVEIH